MSCWAMLCYVAIVPTSFAAAAVTDTDKVSQQTMQDRAGQGSSRGIEG